MVNKKRRRAISPNSQTLEEPPSSRARGEPEKGTANYREVLATLSIEDQEMVDRAASLGLERVDRPRVVNRRHAVSREYPVPPEVSFLYM